MVVQPETLTRPLCIRSQIKAGARGLPLNRCEALAVRSQIKAGARGLPLNRCEALATA